MDKMASPFHEEQGVKHMHGDIEYEWRTLLETPCYGFSGPNACYSLTCNHNPLPSKTEKRVNKLKLSNSLKLSAKYQPKKSPNCERVTGGGYYYNSFNHFDHHLGSTKQIYDYISNQMDYYELPRPNDIVDSDSNEKNQLYDDLPLSEKTKILNQYETSDYNSGHGTCSEDSPNDEISPTISERSESVTNEIDVFEKKYEFNPLSEPFHPSRNIYSSSSSCSTNTDNFKCNSSVCVSESNEDDLDNSTTLFMNKNYICILCPERFSTLDELNKHLENKIQKPYNCFACGVSYKHNYSLYRHIKNHRVMKIFKCRGCYKHFRNLHQLGKHFDVCPYNVHMFI